MLSNRQTDRQKNTHTNPTTVTLAAHARRGLNIMMTVIDLYSRYMHIVTLASLMH